VLSWRHLRANLLSHRKWYRTRAHYLMLPHNEQVDFAVLPNSNRESPQVIDEFIRLTPSSFVWCLNVGYGVHPVCNNGRGRVNNHLGSWLLLTSHQITMSECRIVLWVVALVNTFSPILLRRVILSIGDANLSEEGEFNYISWYLNCLRAIEKVVDHSLEFAW
jgi:hypothetical protein